MRAVKRRGLWRRKRRAANCRRQPYVNHSQVYRRRSASRDRISTMTAPTSKPRTDPSRQVKCRTRWPRSRSVKSSSFTLTPCRSRATASMIVRRVRWRRPKRRTRRLLRADPSLKRYSRARMQIRSVGRHDRRAAPVSTVYRERAGMVTPCDSLEALPRRNPLKCASAVRRRVIGAVCFTLETAVTRHSRSTSRESRRRAARRRN